MITIRYRFSLAAVAALATLAPTAANAAPAHRAVTGCAGGSAMTWTTTTASYGVRLRVGMPETMYTQARVKKMHPKTGEVMMGGQMGMAGMSMGANNAAQHVEVQICSKTTGAVLTNVKPTITVSDSMGMATHVPVAMMRGVTSGMDDAHYGNNLKLPMAQKITVKVSLNGETAIFNVQMPKHL